MSVSGILASFSVAKPSVPITTFGCLLQTAKGARKTMILLWVVAVFMCWCFS